MSFASQGNEGSDIIKDIDSTSSKTPISPPITAENYGSQEVSEEGYNDMSIADINPRVQLLYFREDEINRIRRQESDRRWLNYDPKLFYYIYIIYRRFLLAAFKGDGRMGAYHLCD